VPGGTNSGVCLKQPEQICYWDRDRERESGKKFCKQCVVRWNDLWVLNWDGCEGEAVMAPLEVTLRHALREAEGNHEIPEWSRLVSRSVLDSRADHGHKPKLYFVVHFVTPCCLVGEHVVMSRFISFRWNVTLIFAAITTASVAVTDVPLWIIYQGLNTLQRTGEADLCF